MIQPPSSVQQGRPRPKVFISYAREDTEIAERLFNDLQQAGAEPWRDEENLSPGSIWELEINKAIKRSDFLLALLSSRSLQKRGFIQKELRSVLSALEEIPEGAIWLIPVRIDACEPAFEKLQRLQHVDLFPSYDDGVKKIIGAICPQRKHQSDPADPPLAESVRLLSEARTATYDEKDPWRGMQLALDALPRTGSISETSLLPEASRLLLEAFWLAGAARVLDMFSQEEKIRELVAHDKKGEFGQRISWLFSGPVKPPPVHFAFFSDDGSSVITEYSNGLNFYWDATTGKLINIGGFQLFDRFTSPDGTSRLLVNVPDGFGALLYTDGGARSVRLDGHQAPIRVCAFSQSGTRIVTGSQDGTARIWDASSGSTLAEFPGHPGWVTAVALSPDGNHVVTGAEDNRVWRWDARTGRFIEMLRGHSGYISDLAFSPDGRQLVSASSDGSARLWDCTNWQALGVMARHQGAVVSAAFNSDGDKVVTASIDGYAIVWPVFSRAEDLIDNAQRYLNTTR